MNSDTSHQTDFERQFEFDFLRATEIAALNTLQWLGKGQKEKADEAACSGTVRFIEAQHDLDRTTIHLRSTGVERQI